MTFFELAEENAVHLRILTGWSLGTSRDGASFIGMGPDGRKGSVGRYVPEFEAANAFLLNAGASLGDLRDAVVEAGGTQAGADYVDWLERLCASGLLEFPLVDASGERAVVLPQRSAFVPILAEDLPDPGAKLDRFASIRRDGDAWLVESPFGSARVRLPHLESINDPLVRRALTSAGILETCRPPHDSLRQALAQWEFHDLVFHAHHRDGWHHDPMGLLCPFIDELDAPATVRACWPGERIPLPQAPTELGGESFVSVLKRRRSVRSYDEEHPISIRDLGIVLDRAARIQRRITTVVQNARGRVAWYECARHSYPSGGACHELELYPVVARCDGLDPGLYHYDASGHALVQVSQRTSDTDRMVAHASMGMAGLANPQIVLAITARFARVTWKYRSIAYGVILRNVGALYQTLYLVATELGLSPCGLGNGDSALFSRVTRLDPVIEGTVGEFVLGGRPARLEHPD